MSPSVQVDHILLNPVFHFSGTNIQPAAIGAAGRVVTNGRLWEGFSVDPYLAGILGAETVKGANSAGVITSAKHYILNEQETSRQAEGPVAAVSSNVDDKTMHELYLWYVISSILHGKVPPAPGGGKQWVNNDETRPFQDAVKAGTGSVMCR